MFLLSLVLSLMVCAPAGAAGLSVADAKRIADQAWPASRCAGQLVVVGTTELGAPDRDGLYVHDGSCRILVRPGLPPDRRCDVIVHEAGHAAGLALSTERPDGSWEDHHPATGVMAAHGGEWPACHPPARVESTRTQIRGNVRALLPAPGPWMVRCGPTRSRVTRCTARQPGRVTRRLRVVTHRRVFAITQTAPLRWVASADRVVR
jgi:hypothetical protein